MTYKLYTVIAPIDALDVNPLIYTGYYWECDEFYDNLDPQYHTPYMMWREASEDEVPSESSCAND